MMDNPTANTSHIPCQSWADQNGWPTASTQGPVLNSLFIPQHLSLGSAFDQRPPYDHLQASNQSCMSDLSTLSSRSNSHHTAQYTASHISSNLSSTSLFANSIIPSLSQIISCGASRYTYWPTIMWTRFKPGITEDISTYFWRCWRIHSQPCLIYFSVDTFITLQGDVCFTSAHTETVNQVETGVDSYTRYVAASAIKSTRLESLPPDDKSGEKPQHTAIQVQSQLLVDCSSPASYDEQNQTCDSPDDPMSAAELEETENASADSADSDPDFSPNNDGDLSDADDGFSDESSDSSPPTTQKEETPHPKSLPGKRRDESDKSVSPLKKKCITDQEKSSTVELPTSNSEVQCVYDKRNYCPFCSKPTVKMARHLERIHSDKAEVAAAFQYPKNSRERRKIWNRLKNQGNFAHNTNVLKKGKGQFIVPRTANQPTIKGLNDRVHCLYCRGLYLKKTLFRHLRLCPEKVRNDSESQIGRKRIASRCVLDTIGDLGVSDGFRELLSQMTYNDVTQAVMDDKIILQFGEQMFDQQGSNAKRHEHIRQNLRQIARLVLEAQKITPLKKVEDFFLPSSFSHVVSAVNVLAGYDPEKKTYSTPSLAIKLGYHLQKCCSIVERNAMQSGDTRLVESAQNFLSVYQKKWNTLVSSGALSALREIKLTTEKKVPFSQDVKRLNFHMENVHLLAEKKLTECPSTENYAALAKIVLAQTIIFNRRRIQEVSEVPLTAFMSRKKSNLPDNFDVSVSELERTMCGFFTRIDIQGRCGKMVPILLKPSFVSALELLVSVREKCGVPSENLFLFARPRSLSAYKGSECIQKSVKKCGAKDREALTLANIQKHYATMLQMINLDENEADQILGPNNHVRTLRQNSGMQVDDDQMDSEERLQHESGYQPASWDQSELSGSSYTQADFYDEQAHGATAGTSMTVPPKSGNSGKKGSQNQGKHKWEEAEICAVERHMMRFIQGHKVPQKNDCTQCLEAEPKALRTRSWKGVKDYVRNRITALKRQSSTYQA
ncbi:uncharacterized protein LOC128364858 [Scomber japonicus]|uniref:uncharacterized protein LOC128364858 n=1 Tax=Scomber japonicus TaxID=13676 RepID=UPI00230599B8|nr:uncharacterized protein LOC128364858 [Scomber japonicus]